MSLDALLDALLGIQPVPGLSLAFHTLRFIVNCIQQVTESRRQLEELASSVAQLLAALNAEFADARLVKSTSAGALVDLHSLLKDIQKFVQKEQERGFFVALLHQDARISGINGFYRRIGTIANSFQESTCSISALWNIKVALEKDRQARKDDGDALNGRLKNLEKNQAELRRVLDVNQGNMMAIMVSIERKLASQRVKRMTAVQQTFYGHALQYLTVLSGQQVKAEDWMITPFEVDFGKEVGSGGFGRVYRGTWNHTEVAIKVVRNVAGVTPRAEVLRGEIDIWSTLRHPHILQFLGANTLDEHPFIVTPYMRGTARQLLHKWPHFDPVYILRDISLGLEYLHGHPRTICHGDLKGANVLIDHSNRALLCDFGLARVKADVTSRTGGMAEHGPTICGSRNWMAPELFTGVPASTRSDMYAFGMTVFELYADEDPLCHIRNHDFFELVCQKNLRPSRPGNIPPLTDLMWALATACWAKRSSDRPTALKVVDVLSFLITEMSRRNVKNAVAVVQCTDAVPNMPADAVVQPVNAVPIIQPSPTVRQISTSAKSHVLRLGSGAHYIRFVPIQGAIPFNGSFIHGPIICKLTEGLTPISFGRTRTYTSDLTGISMDIMKNQQDTAMNSWYREAISPLHAEICAVPGPRFLIRDTKSSKGTSLNGSRLSAFFLARELHNGDTVQLGRGARSIIMRVELQQSAPHRNISAEVYGPMQPPLNPKTQDSQNGTPVMESSLGDSIFVQLIEKTTPKSSSSSSAKPAFGSILCRIVEDVTSLHIRRWDPTATQAADGVFFDSPTISRDHACLKYQGGPLLIRDTHSRTGTFLNGSKIGKEHWSIVKDGDVLELQAPAERDNGRQKVLATVRTWELDGLALRVLMGQQKELDADGGV
ncbi:kinase-like domain-containing protein [Roridomyces roridus]|uniref:Kinase-like domain-containing protein n=1 Tax=Roridomyces roridus TaxID=1738132 RepID=A0AAD7FJY0_9AGAR|nr:kinase-like domain-containing protein [Roridomyces roridus]